MTASLTAQANDLTAQANDLTAQANDLTAQANDLTVQQTGDQFLGIVEEARISSSIITFSSDRVFHWHPQKDDRWRIRDQVGSSIAKSSTKRLTELAQSNLFKRAWHDVTLTEIFLILVASFLSLWLIHSLAQSPGEDGGFWSYIMAIGFDVTPMLLAGAAVRGRWHAFVNQFSAIAIFAVGLMVFTSPKIQTLHNEYKSYQDSQAKYKKELALAKKQDETNQEKIKNAQSSYDDAKAKYDNAASGESGGYNLRKLENDRNMRLSALSKAQEEAKKIKFPDAPKVSDDLRSSCTDLLMRIGLFFAAFSAMRARRQLRIS
jgi:hypothetical protein